MIRFFFSLLSVVSFLLVETADVTGQIINGDFSNGLQGWTVTANNNNGGTAVSPEGAAVIDSGVVGFCGFFDCFYSTGFTRISQTFYLPTDSITVPDLLTFDMARIPASPWSFSYFNFMSATLFLGGNEIWSAQATATPTTYTVPLVVSTDVPYRIEFLAESDNELWFEGYDEFGYEILVERPESSALTVDNVTLGWNSRGATQADPILPNSTEGLTFQFINVPSGMWFDPPAVSSFIYNADPGTLFAEIMDFPTGFSDEFFVSVDGNILGEFGPGESVDFVSLFGDGISEFTISGINPLVDAEDPLAFPLQIAFTTPTGSFMMTAVVPEPASAALISIAFMSLAWRNRDSRLARRKAFG